MKIKGMNWIFGNGKEKDERNKNGKSKREIGRRGMTWETLIPWLIAITVLVLIGFFAYMLKDQLFELGMRIKGAFRG